MTGRVEDRLASVCAEIRVRRERDRIFAGLHAANPRWAIVLELEAALLSGQPQILLGKLIRDAGMTHTTGLRTIDSMIAGDWLTSTRDPKDAHRRLISLGPRAVRAIAQYRARFGYARAKSSKSIELPDGAQIDLEDAIAATAAPGLGRRPEKAATRSVLDAPAALPADVSAPEGRPSRRPAELPGGARGHKPETVSP